MMYQKRCMKNWCIVLQGLKNGHTSACQITVSLNHLTRRHKTKFSTIKSTIHLPDTVCVKSIWAASWQNQQNDCAPSETQISLGIRLVWSESSLSAQWVAKDPSCLHADSEDSDQTGLMPRLIWVFAGRTATLLVLSWGGSNDKWITQFAKTMESSRQLCVVVRLAKYKVYRYIGCIIDRSGPFSLVVMTSD